MSRRPLCYVARRRPLWWRAGRVLLVSFAGAALYVAALVAIGVVLELVVALIRWYVHA